MKAKPAEQFSEYMKIWRKGGTEWKSLMQHVYEERKRNEKYNSLRG
ncbi:MAG TPA: hypothetical protein VJI32_04115 [Candidatus Nanoarchaeia archaeon]|nr:hypothetical protein [Candidatus Nanoarchaeia archaeon]